MKKKNSNQREQHWDQRKKNGHSHRSSFTTPLLFIFILFIIILSFALKN